MERKSSSQNETHRTQRAKLVGVDQYPALFDAEAVAGLAQDVAIAADIFADALVAAEAVADEVGRNRNQVPFDADDAHIADHTAGARLWIFGVAVGVVDADDALANALPVVGHDEQRRAMI